MTVNLPFSQYLYFPNTLSVCFSIIGSVSNFSVPSSMAYLLFTRDPLPLFRLGSLGFLTGFPEIASSFENSTNINFGKFDRTGTLRSTYAVVTDVKTCHIYPGRLTLLPKTETIEQRRLGSVA